MSLMHLFARRKFSRSFITSRRLRFEQLEAREVPSVTLGDVPDSTFPVNKPLFVPITATASDGPVDYSVVSKNSTGIGASILQGGRSLKIDVTGKDSNNQVFSGSLTIRLFEDIAPLATGNIVTLANSNYYDGKLFHRVVNDFVIQGGSPNGDGVGGSKDVTDAKDEYNAEYTFASRGIVAMANAGDDNNNAQFFITDPFTLTGGVEGPAPLERRSQSLNFNHSIVGILTSGFDLYQRIMDVPRAPGNDGAVSKPINPVTITDVTVFTDDRNAVVKLSSVTNGVDSSLAASEITVTATQGGDTKTEVFTVNTVGDTVNDRPFLGAIGNITTGKNTEAHFTLPFTEIDSGDTLTFAVGRIVTNANGTQVFAEIDPTQATASVDSQGAVTVKPASGFIGVINLVVGVRDGTDRIFSAAGINDARNYDTQKLTVTVSSTTPNTAPTIADIPNQATNQDQAVGPIGFIIGDAETSADKLTVNAISSNGTLVPAANVVFGGSGANRTVTVTPAAGQSGTTTITVTVTDENSLTTTDTFDVVVTAPGANTPPTISDIPKQVTTTGKSIGPIAFTIADAETPVANLTLTVTSSNTTLIPIANVVFGGSGSSRTITITPAADQTGIANLTVTVKDGGNLVATDSFDVSVNAPPNTAPTISTIANQTTTSGKSVGPIAFTVKDTETAVGSLTLTAASSNATLIPAENITFGGTGANRTVTVVSATGRTGTATITITVKDGGNLTATETFDVVVTAAPDAPTTTTIALVSSKSSTSIGRPVTFTATVENGADGVVQFVDGSTIIGNIPIVDGRALLSATFDTAATHSVTAKYIPDAGAPITSTASTVTVNTALAAPIAINAEGIAPGTASPVTVKNADGSVRFTVDPFPGFTGGVRVKVADVTNDGQADVVTVPGAGGSPIIVVFDGATGRELLRVMIFEESFRGGLNLDVGDSKGLGYAQILVGAGDTGGPRVTLFDAFQNRVLLNYFAYESNNRGGVSVALSDLRGGNVNNIITGAGAGLAPNVNVYDPFTTANPEEPVIFGSFIAGSAENTTGIKVGAGPLIDNERRDVLVGPVNPFDAPLDQSFNPITLGVFVE